MIYIGSARHDENGKLSGGAAGDQLQGQASNYIGSDDHTGEVSFQEFYVHRLGWYVIRPMTKTHAAKMAEAMIMACNNKNIGYDQNQRLGVISKGVNTQTKTECDCSSLVRACIKYATGKDVGNFTTANELTTIMASKMFTNVGKYIPGKTVIKNGDILVTQKKGHTVIVVSGSPR